MISYERAKEAWLREILSEELQQLESGFLDDLSQTMNAVSEEVDKSEDLRRSLLSAERDRLEGFLKGIVERRLSKIARAASLGEKLEGLDPEEKQVLTSVESALRTYKERFYRFPREVTPESLPTASSTQVSETSPGPEAGKLERISTAPERPPVPMGERNQLLRILVEFPSFVGPDLKAYGPSAKEDLVALSDEISEILIGRKIGRRISPAGEES